MTVKIAKQTDAAVSSTFSIATDYQNVPANNRLQATFRVTGGALGTGEYVKLQYHDGTEWRDANIEGNEGKILDVDNAVATIYGRMTNIRVEKSVTANALGVEVC
jgi:hypothetical protein